MEDWDIKTIVLGYDGSEGSKRAAGLAGTLARKHAAHVVVVTVFPHKWFRSYEEPGQPAETRADIGPSHEVAGELIEQYKAAGISAEPDVMEGPAGDALLHVAEAHKADLIVVGRRGHGRTESLLLGSTSEFVVRRAKIPVLVAN